MNVMVVAVFDTETAALEGLQALRDLHKEGGISLYASAVIVKDATGKLSVRKPAEDGPLGSALGFLTGGLIGLLGGPPGMAVGAYAGGVAGSLFDVAKAGADLTFLDDVSKQLTPGKAAVLAEVEEAWTTLLDSRLQEHGGTVFRRFRADVVDDQLVREGEALEANLEALDDELASASAENRAAIQKDIDKAKQQLKATQDQTKAQLDQAKAEMDARINTLQDQAKAARDRAKARIEKRMGEVRTDFAARSKKLNQALTLAREALKP